MLKFKYGISVLVLLISTANIWAAKPTSSKEETAAFSKYVGRFVPQTEEDYWFVITGLEQLLKDYPNTYLKGNIHAMLLTHYSHVTKDESLLTDLAEKTISLQGENSGAYYQAAKALVDCEIRSDKTVQYAQKAVAEARDKFEKWGEYEGSVFHAQKLLAQAYQLTGKHQKAIQEIRQVIQGWQSVKDPRLSLANRQAMTDQARVQLAQFYVDEKNWHKAYALASDLLEASVVRDEAIGVWNDAYVGRFGSAKGMAEVYADLNAAREKKIVQRVKTERISKSAPNFSVETLDGKTIQLSDLKGKPVVVTFWAGWCSPCIEELPYLNQLKAQFRDVEFLAINIDEDSNTRRDMVAHNRFQRGMNLTFVLGDLETRKAFGGEEIPYTCVIDADGNVRYERKGMGADFSTAMRHQIGWVASLKK